MVEDSPDYEILVTPNGNATAPVHRWFHMKEAFSKDLLRRVLKDTGLEARPALSVLDPFTGGGTTAVSLATLVAEGELQRGRFAGIETNPFLHMLSSAKIDALLTDRVPDVERRAQRIASAVLRSPLQHVQVPALSTFADPRFFPKGHVRELVRLRELVDDHCEDAPLARQLLLVCVAGAAEPSSFLRRDGRALRVEGGKEPTRPVEEFVRRAEVIAEDLKRVKNFAARVAKADSRHPHGYSGRGYDLCLFSPPYPNNIDYTEVYKMESWLLGFISDQSSFSQQRRTTLRSHPSLKFDGSLLKHREDHDAVADLTAPLVRAIPPGRYRTGRKRTVVGYCEDMLLVLRETQRRLRVDGRLVIAVGNSLHGVHADDQLLVASDLLICRLAEHVGFHVDRIDVARRPKRRAASNPLLRESVLFLTKRRGGVDA